MLLGCGTKTKPEDTESQRELPNILFVILDDAGWNDVGYNGSEIRTPHIDELAKNGLQLNRFYVAPTCSPTRAALLTGMPASRLGILAPISGKGEKTLPDSIITLPAQLKTIGYQTALFGKWHLGLQPANGPSAYGFDYSYGFLHGQIDQYSHEYKNGDPSWHRNGEFISEEGHATELIGKETIHWLRYKRDSLKPFFAQVAYSAPHFPLQEPKEWVETYAEIENDSRRDFAAAMSHVDDDMGKLLAELKAMELSENTLIIFMSDNGGMENWYPEEQYEGKHGPNDVLGDNTPLRNWKSSNYEGGIRVPAIISLKDKFKAGVSNEFISVTDLMPSILEMVNADIPSNVEGAAIFDDLVNGAQLKNEIYIRGHKQQSLIKAPWKLVRTPGQGNRSAEFELFHIENDPEESKNLSDMMPDRVSELKKLMAIHINRDQL
ncbi:sulfatase-like hydrolase/transferase [Pseudozobellia sp. WGM2]|uniref:sulfatase-like hydrolase/transferase n=1 Tax=Pseudozobellia sp. WGM2 TaxID=2787625 RepID=UPI001AE06967|nr:sulfatase-like hydrolase/transferase [Pseudozobellia sp. WGM2]